MAAFKLYFFSFIFLLLYLLLMLLWYILGKYLLVYVFFLYADTFKGLNVMGFDKIIINWFSKKLIRHGKVIIASVQHGSQGNGWTIWCKFLHENFPKIFIVLIERKTIWLFDILWFFKNRSVIVNIFLILILSMIICMYFKIHNGGYMIALINYKNKK